MSGAAWLHGEHRPCHAAPRNERVPRRSVAASNQAKRAVAPCPVRGKQRLTFMIDFRGKGGWHEARWRSGFEPNRDTLDSTSVFDLGSGWMGRPPTQRGA